MRLLITGGTVFVSKYVAGYFVSKGDEVYVLNRNSRPQIPGVRLIEADRHSLKDELKGKVFDAVIDVTAYTALDITDLLDAIDSFGKFVMISSSAVYPVTEPQPYTEDAVISDNNCWGKYATDKIEAEKTLLSRIPDAYILRPPYLYGPMNNVYREAFVFDCAMQDRKFYLPRNGEMKLQFFHVRDLCRVIEAIITEGPEDHVFNVGNSEAVSIKEWATLCYESVGKKPEFVNVFENIDQRAYFSFYDYEYKLDITRQNKLISDTVSLKEGLKECFEWYKKHADEVRRKPLIEFIDANLTNK